MSEHPRDRPLRVANCSGFFGDRQSAAREMVEGGPIDVLTGDWLAELTMVVLHKTRERSGGYAGTFLRQMEEVLATCLERGVKVVSNAGGLAPAACAEAVRAVAARQGLEARVASVAGDDLIRRIPELLRAGERLENLDTKEPLSDPAGLVTANAYLGGAPIAAALSAGADVVVTGRVTDASLVVGPGIWAFGWGPDDLDALAGAVVAGHVIECGAQCCGGNYSFFNDLAGIERIGFPLVELAADGSAVVTKHPGTGGAVTVGTVTAQLLYEIGGPRYLSPDAVARFDTIEVAEVGPDRVRIASAAGEPPPSTLKVTANLAAGWRNSVTFVLTGSDIGPKAEAAEVALWARVPGGRPAFDQVSAELFGDLSGGGVAFLRLAVAGSDQELVGRGFSGAAVETALSTFPGAFYTGAPTPAQAAVRTWPTTVAADLVEPVIELDHEAIALGPEWRRRPVPAPSAGVHGAERGAEPGAEPGAERGGAGAVGPAEPAGPAGPAEPAGPADGDVHVLVPDDLVEVPLGALAGGRSGDKAGNANLGLWAEEDDVFDWMVSALDAGCLRRLLPEIGDLEVERHLFANLRAVNFVISGLLGWGVAANLRLDGQGKALAELARSRTVRVPRQLVASGKVAARLRASRPGAAGRGVGSSDA